MTEVLGWLPLTSANYSTCALKEYNFSWTALTSTNAAIIKLSPPRYFVRQTAFRTATRKRTQRPVTRRNACSRGLKTCHWKKMPNVLCYYVSRFPKLWPVWALRRQIRRMSAAALSSTYRLFISISLLLLEIVGAFTFPCVTWHTIAVFWSDKAAPYRNGEEGGWEIKEGKKEMLFWMWVLKELKPDWHCYAFPLIISAG